MIVCRRCVFVSFKSSKSPLTYLNNWGWIQFVSGSHCIYHLAGFRFSSAVMEDKCDNKIIFGIFLPLLNSSQGGVDRKWGHQNSSIFSSLKARIRAYPGFWNQVIFTWAAHYWDTPKTSSHWDNRMRNALVSFLKLCQVYSVSVNCFHWDYYIKIVPLKTVLKMMCSVDYPE